MILSKSILVVVGALRVVVSRIKNIYSYDRKLETVMFEWIIESCGKFGESSPGFRQRFRFLLT